eukprot:297291-Amphidinium_carterae.1
MSDGLFIACAMWNVGCTVSYPLHTSNPGGAPVSNDSASFQINSSLKCWPRRPTRTHKYKCPSIKSRGVAMIR